MSTVMELHCPFCHHTSGNTLTVDWPFPLEVRTYKPLVCRECAREFEFQVDADGMRCMARSRDALLAEFLDRRRRGRQRAT